MASYGWIKVKSGDTTHRINLDKVIDMQTTGGMTIINMEGDIEVIVPESELFDIDIDSILLNA